MEEWLRGCSRIESSQGLQKVAFPFIAAATSHFFIAGQPIGNDLKEKMGGRVFESDRSLRQAGFLRLPKVWRSESCRYPISFSLVIEVFIVGKPTRGSFRQNCRP